jgi:hypothetical protein
MSRSLCSERVALAPKLAVLVAPLMAWAAPASASPEMLAAPAVVASADALAPSSDVAASQVATPDVPAASATVRAMPSPKNPWIGAMADVGLPDGATLSIVYRPIRSIRAHAGLSHNLISLGERAGVTWSPLSWWASPTLSLEYGHYADGNANPLARAVIGDTAFSSAVLDRVGYDYANAHLGVELGRRWFTFYLHAGVSRINATVHNLGAETMAQSAGTTTISFSQDPRVQLWSASARIGFIVYLAK